MKEYDVIVYKRAEHVGYVVGYESKDISDDETYVANLLTSKIAVLQGPSALIWDLLKEPQTAEGIISEIKEIYGVQGETVEEGVLNFLKSLVEQGLAKDTQE